MSIKKLLLRTIVMIFLGRSFSTQAQTAPGGVNPGSSLQLWVRADAGLSTTGSTVNGWTNQADNTRNMVSWGPTVFPVVPATSAYINFNPVVEFGSGGNNNTLYTPGIIVPANSNLTRFVLFNSSSTVSGFSNIMGSGCPSPAANATITFWKQTGSNTISQWANFGTGNYGNTVSFTPDFPQIGTSVYSAGTANGTYIRISGAKNTATTSSTSYADSHIQLGAAYNIGGGVNTNFFTGYIPEAIVYSTALTATQVQQVESYLAIKYGITLDQSTSQNYISSAGAGSIFWDASAGGVYKNNIAGIGRDDASALLQKQSKSINSNTNGQVTIGVGTIATTNAGNTTAYSGSNKSFLMWADNGVTTSLATASTAFTYNGVSTNVRMNRIWQVQNTGVNQQVQLQFPTASVGTVASPSGTCVQYAIIYSTDPTFATGVTATVLTTSGSNYVVNRKFPQGVSYFTFAKITQQAPGTVYLPTSNINASTTSTCTTSGWKYYYYDAGQTQKAIAINWNGNTEPGGVNGTVTYNAAAYSQTYSSYQCNIMGRLMQVLPAGGSYTTNGGVKVRIFFDSTELNASLVGTPLSQRWFKYSGNGAATIAANNGTNITAAQWLTPSSSGEEDGVDYVEFSGIQSFSTFGFASNTGIFPLPVKLESFSATAEKCAAVISWKTAEEINTDRFIVEQSRDAINFSPVATVSAKNNFGGAVYQQTIAQNEQQAYYRLKIINTNGTYTYSSVLHQKVSCGQVDVISIYPNPLNGADKMGVHISTTYRGAVKLSVYNAQGQAIVVKQVPVNSAETIYELGVKEIPQGTYLLRCTTSDGVELSKALKIIK